MGEVRGDGIVLHANLSSTLLRQKTAYEGIVFHKNDGYLGEANRHDDENTRLGNLENNQKLHRSWMTILTLILAVVGFLTFCIMAIDVYLDHSF